MGPTMCEQMMLLCALVALVGTCAGTDEKQCSAEDPNCSVRQAAFFEGVPDDADSAMKFYAHKDRQVTPTIQDHPSLLHYMFKNSLRSTQTQDELMREIYSAPNANMAGSPDEAQFLVWMAKVIQAKRAIEVGVFRGSTTLALGLTPSIEKIVAIDLNTDYVSTGQKYWVKAGIAHKVDLRIGAALDKLDELIQEGGAGTYDIAFIDADKENQEAYFEKCLLLLRKGGVIALDNVLWKGKVLVDDATLKATSAGALADSVDTNAESSSKKDIFAEGALAIKNHNAKLLYDERVDLSMLTMADGVTLLHKR